MPNNLRRVQRCDIFFIMMKPELVIYILFLDQRHTCFSIKNEKYIKALSD